MELVIDALIEKINTDVSFHVLHLHNPVFH